MKHKGNVRNILIDTVKKQKWLSSGILIAVLGAIGASLIPPLLLGKIVDSITAGHAVAFSFFVLYFVVLALTGFMDTARESLLTVFGQKITHQCGYDQSAGTGNDGIKVYRRCGYGREPVYFRNHQHVCGYM